MARERLARNLRREALMRGLLSEIAGVIGHLQIGLLKGPALWGDIYRPGERESSDIDLFVAPRDLAALLAALANLGYVSVPGESEESPLYDFKTVCLSDRYGDLSIELHTKLWWREPAGFTWQWQAARPAPFQRLSLEDQLLHLCGHWIAQHTMISLHWMFDIVLFLQGHGSSIDRNKLYTRAKLLRLSRAVDLALKICDEFSAGQETRLRGFVPLDLNFLIEPRRNLGRYFFIKHAVQESWLDALMYDVSWLRARLGIAK